MNMTVSISIPRIMECVYAMSALRPSPERLYTRDDEAALRRVLDLALANLTLEWLPVVRSVERGEDIVELTLATTNPVVLSVVEGWLAEAALAAAEGRQCPVPPGPATQQEWAGACDDFIRPY